MSIAAVRAQLRTVDVAKVRNSINRRYERLGQLTAYCHAMVEALGSIG